MDELVAPTHWSFGQLVAIVATPAAYVRGVAEPLAAVNLQYGQTSHRAEQIIDRDVAMGILPVATNSATLSAMVVAMIHGM